MFDLSHLTIEVVTVHTSPILTSSLHRLMRPCRRYNGRFWWRKRRWRSDAPILPRSRARAVGTHDPNNKIRTVRLLVVISTSARPYISSVLSVILTHLQKLEDDRSTGTKCSCLYSSAPVCVPSLLHFSTSLSCSCADNAHPFFFIWGIVVCQHIRSKQAKDQKWYHVLCNYGT
jgi:hypothetical protein